MAAPVAILAKPDDHRGILTMAEAVNAMIEAFRNWAQDPLVAELRRRTHTPKNVRITLHQGAAPAYGTTGIMTHAELVRIFGDKQKYPRRGRPVLVLYDSDTAALKLILVGEMHPQGAAERKQRGGDADGLRFDGRDRSARAQRLPGRGCFRRRGSG